MNRLLLTFVFGLLGLFAGSRASGQEVDFAHEVVPILRMHCGKCHTGDARQGGLSINSRQALLSGGDSGRPGFIDGQSGKSEIIARVVSGDLDYRMPPEGKPLPTEAIATLRRWIDAKAPWTEGFAFKGARYEAPLGLRAVELPAARDGRTNPIDRLVDAYWERNSIQRPPRSDDRAFIRRVSLDLVGLLPEPERVERFVADPAPDKRSALARELLAQNIAYAEHWLTFWNDLLRNDYSGTGFITGGRRQITTWLHRSLVANKPYDQFVRELVAPADESRGFIEGIIWRGEVNASQTVPIQFAQNFSQTFLGINLKCASCHDSFIDRWTLRQTYDLAAIYSPKTLELHRCDKATGVMAAPAWLFSDLGQVDASAPPAERLSQLAAIATKPENGWLTRTLANRLWHRLLGRGIVHPVDALRTPPWDEALLDFLAHDLVDHRWDVKHTLEMICTSEAYGAATPPVMGQPQGADYVFYGPLPRRMTAEQFIDAVWKLTDTAPAKPDADVLRFEVSADRADELPAPVAKWIWSNAQAEAPAGEKLSFRATFQLGAPAVHAVVALAADNEAVLTINDKPAVASQDWTQPVTGIVTGALKQGANKIVITAANGAAGGPAALRVELRVRLANGANSTIASDSSWQRTVALPDGNGRFAKGKEPTDWAPAEVIVNQAIWSAAEVRFSDRLRASTAAGELPMVRAALVKATALMAALGRPNRDQVVTSRPSELTTLEAIQLANEPVLAEEVAKGGARILERRGPQADAMIEWMFAAALARHPTSAEAATLRDLLGEQPQSQTVADGLWAIFMLPEFQLIR
jgi:hypothetical protein